MGASLKAAWRLATLQASCRLSRFPLIGRRWVARVSTRIASHQRSVALPAAQGPTSVVPHVDCLQHSRIDGSPNLLTGIAQRRQLQRTIAWEAQYASENLSRTQASACAECMPSKQMPHEEGTWMGVETFEKTFQKHLKSLDVE